MAYPVDQVELKRTFDAFDVDGSGAVDKSEIREMAISMGMVFDGDALDKMIKQADIDGDGEIDFEEFKAIVEKAASAQKPDEKTAASFGAIAMRKQNCGPPMKWREDKFGPGVAADGDKVTHAAGAGQGCALLDVNCSGAGYNAASVLLECSAISSCFIGVVGSNFVHSKLDEPFDTCALAAAVRHDGEVFRKGQNLGPIIKLSELQSGGFVSLELDMQDQELTITVLNKDKGLISSVSVDNVPVEVCVAVSFGKATTAEPQSVRVVGSSSEKVPKKFVKKTGGADLWDDGNAQKLGHEQGSKGGHTAADVAAMMG